jgi:lipoprotein-anchoring transpeptidase ErfK/SrfK
MKKRLLLCLIFVSGLVAGCVAGESGSPANTTPRSSSSAPSPAATASSTPVSETAPVGDTKASGAPLTLPVLDAFLADEKFSVALKERMQLSDEQIRSLKDLAHSETGRLNEESSGKGDGEGAAARAAAAEKIDTVIGSEKRTQLAALLTELWASGNNGSGRPTENSADSLASVPTDSRIIVNAPAFRMDVFEAGRLIKSYKIAIGYPEFPLPSGLRQARTIVFNPTWTPPDEPWIARMNVTAGEKIEAGSKLNPLGPIKIPIGGPSLIHGGKPVAKLGTFGSHGCVGLTTRQMRDFTKILARLGGSRLTDQDLDKYARDPTHTKEIKLSKPVPVELRYQTIVVEDGSLHVYRDVYDQNLNTEENLRSVLEANNIRLEDLTAEERTKTLDTLAQMAGRKTARRTVALQNSGPTASPGISNAAAKQSKPTAKTSRIASNQKETVIEIAALKGKGYPSPMNLDNGSGKSNSAN